MEKWSNLILLKRHRLNTKWRSLMPESSGAALLACGKKDGASSFSRLFLSAFNKWKEGGGGGGGKDDANVLVWGFFFLQYVLESSTLNHADGIHSLTRHHADNYTFFTGFLLLLSCFLPPPSFFFHSCVSVARSSGPLISECLYRVSHPILQRFGPEIGSELWQRAFVPFIFSSLRNQRR